MWQLQQISLAYGAQEILKNLSGEIRGGDFVALQGSNGSGKSTLFGVIAGSLSPSQGKILCNGVDITSQCESQRSLYLGRLMQDPAMGCALDLTVAQNMALAAMKARAARLQSVRDPLNEELRAMAKGLGLPLDKLYHQRVARLSGGQRQAIALMMVLFTDPKLLLLDEPTAALDPQAASRLLHFIRDWTHERQIATLMITHSVEEAKGVCNRTWQLVEGRIDVSPVALAI